MRKTKVLGGSLAALVVSLSLVAGCKGRPKDDGQSVTAPAPAGGAAAAAKEAPKAPADPHGGAAAQGAMDLDKLHAAAPPEPPPPPDENARRVWSWPVTMKRVEAYAAALKDLRAAGEKDPTLMAKLRAPAPPGEGPEAMAKRLEGIGPLKAVLDKRGLAGLDLLVLPHAITTSRAALAAERAGQLVKPDEVNLAALELFRKNPTRMEEIAQGMLADMRVLSGR